MTTMTLSKMPRRVFLGAAGMGIYTGSQSALFPAIKAHAQINNAQLGIALLLASSGIFIGTLLLAPILIRTKTYALGIAIGAVGLAVPFQAFATNLWQVALSLFFVFMLCANLNAVWNNVISTYEHKLNQSLMQKGHAIYPVFLLASSLLSGLASSLKVSMTWILLTNALVILVSGLYNFNTISPHIERAKTKIAFTLPLALVVLGTLGALAYVCEYVISSWSAIHISTTLGGNAFWAASGAAISAVAMIAGRLGAHKFGDKDKTKIMTLTGLLLIGGFLALALAPNIPIALIGCALVGLGNAPWAPLIYGAAGRYGRKKNSHHSIGIVMIIFYMGQPLSAGVVGPLAGATSLRIALLFPILAAIALIGTLKFNYVKDLINN